MVISQEDPGDDDAWEGQPLQSGSRRHSTSVYKAHTDNGSSCQPVLYPSLQPLMAESFLFTGAVYILSF